MRRHGIWAVGLAVALLAATPAIARTGPTTRITATGTGEAHVHPANRHENASIVKAVAAAQKIANARALDEAREYAHEYARVAGLKIVRMVSITDVQTSPFGYYPGPSIGRFGPNQYCGEVRVRVGPIVRGQRPTFKKERRCFVPRVVSKSLVITYVAGR